MFAHPGLRRAADDGCWIEESRLVQRSNSVRLIIHLYSGRLGRGRIIIGE
jgi:hypothetical protein